MHKPALEDERGSNKHKTLRVVTNFLTASDLTAVLGI